MATHVEYLLGLLQEKLQDPTTLTASAAAAALIAYWLLKRRPALPAPTVPLDNQSIELEPGIRTSAYAPDGKLVEYFYEDAKTLYECFQRGLRVSNNRPCLGTRSGPNKEFVYQTYKEVADQAHRLGSALIQLGVVPGNDTRIGIFCANRPEWVITEQACNMYSMVLVPLYDTLGKEACTYIINQGGMSVVFVDTQAKAEQLIKNIESIPSVKKIVVVERVSNNNLSKDSQVQVHSFLDLIEKGATCLVDPMPPKPDDAATICYTSGTTGNPKGVVLTHKNVVSNVSSVLIQAELSITPDDVYLSYLPLAHMFERACHVMLYAHGAKIGFFSGDIKLLLDDMGTLRPTLFATVPRLLNRIYDKVQQGAASSSIKKFLFGVALGRKKSLLQQGIVTKSTIWDRLVFSKVQKLLGGRVRTVITGAAPLDKNVLTFIRCAFGCSVMEGYGQTEATAGITFNIPNETEAGHVGPPVPCALVKLVDVPEMDYYAKDGKGEVCAMGPSVMKEYFKEPEKTAEAIDKDNWLHTGDIGMWLPNGTLKIIDRKKHIFKLAQGEYVAPEKIENIYTMSPMIAQCFVDGNSFQTYTVAIVVPDPDFLPGWAAEQGVSGNIEELCKNEVVRKGIHNDMRRLGKQAGLKGFEQVKHIHLHPELFSVENGLLTPTFKSKRPVLRKTFEPQMTAMYSQ